MRMYIYAIGGFKMKIRNFWKEAVLAVFASMWAGCEIVPDDGVSYNPEEELKDSSEVVVRMRNLLCT